MTRAHGDSRAPARANLPILAVALAMSPGCALDAREGLQGDSIERRIDWEGGTVGLCRERDEVGRCTDPGASLSVPWGALDVGGDRVFGIRALIDEEEAAVLGQVPEGLKPASDIFEFTPSDVTFNQALIPVITIPFTVGAEFEGMRPRDIGMLLLRVERPEAPLCVFGVGGGVPGVVSQTLAVMDRADAIFTARRFGVYMIAQEMVSGATKSAKDTAMAEARCQEQ